MDSSLLEQFCRDAMGTGELTDLQQLSGGASMESWRFNFAGETLILRLRPRGLAQEPSESEVALVSLEGQADLIQSLNQAAVKVPRVLAKLPPRHPLGEGFIMQCIEGEALPGRILRKSEFETARSRLAMQCADELARIHAMPVQSLHAELVVKTPDVLLAEQYTYYQQFGSPNPVFELAFSTLRRSCPEPLRMTLVHADFRIGNLLVTPNQGLTAILDWELAHIGDPMRDVSFICTPSWRFGNYSMAAGGFATKEQWLAEYERASGLPVDPDAFQWWLVFNALWWGVTCMRFGSAFKDGSVRTVERAVIGRRVSEVEIDLLLLLERADQSPIRVQHVLPETDTRAGDVNYRDLADSVGEWIKAAVLPDATGHQQFEARVSANAVGIIARALSLQPSFDLRYQARLTALGHTEASLNAALAKDPTLAGSPSIWTHLILTALERVGIDQPQYAGAQVARERWVE